jgi:hypothetical protein
MISSLMHHYKNRTAIFHLVQVSMVKKCYQNIRDEDSKLVSGFRKRIFRWSVRWTMTILSRVGTGISSRVSIMANCWLSSSGPRRSRTNRSIRSCWRWFWYLVYWHDEGVRECLRSHYCAVHVREDQGSQHIPLRRTIGLICIAECWVASAGWNC